MAVHGLARADAGDIRRAAWRIGCARMTAIAALLGLATPVLAAPPTAEDFARPPRMERFVVSPANTHAAFLYVVDTRRVAAAVIDLAEPRSVTIVAAFADGDVTRIRWVNDRRLVFEAFQPGMQIGHDGAGTFAVDRDGQNSRELIKWRRDNESTGTRIASRTLTYGWFYYDIVGDGSDDILVYRRLPNRDGDPSARQLARLDTRNGQLSTLTDGLPPAERWVVDDRGQVRMFVTTRGGRHRLHWKAPGSSEWSVIEDHDAFSNQVLVPLYVESDGQVVVASTRESDTGRLHVYDPAKRKMDPEPLVAVKGFDAGVHIEIDSKAQRVVGLHGQADGAFSVWFDDALQVAQRQVDASLPPGRRNRLLCGQCLGAKRFVVSSWSDRQSGQYYVFDGERRRLTAIGEARPWLPEATQGRRTFHRVAARDGLPLPVVVTHPPDSAAAAPLPAVLLVHGGPWVRGATLGWDDDAQFLASRGYRVLEVDFRGSTGLGAKHFQAGWKQWGLAMQDDLVDALDWAGAQGLIDPKRVCIVGASYGGYAAMMGPIRHPDRYRCAASFAGVTDLALMYDKEGTDISVQARDYSLPQLLGHPQRDAERLRQTSPVHRVGELKAPLLLVQGGLDRRVTALHAERFVLAARPAGATVERVDYPFEGHGWSDPANRADFLRRLEAHLARHLRTP